MKDFFIWCSGASVEIVKKCDDKEISKYTNIGIVVFCVAFLSIFSATYFLSFAFNTEGTNFVWLYLPIGIIWGLYNIVFRQSNCINNKQKRYIKYSNSKINSTCCIGFNDWNCGCNATRNLKFRKRSK